MTMKQIARVLRLVTLWLVSVGLEAHREKHTMGRLGETDKLLICISGRHEV